MTRKKYANRTATHRFEACTKRRRAFCACSKTSGRQINHQARQRGRGADTSSGREQAPRSIAAALDSRTRVAAGGNSCFALTRRTRPSSIKLEEEIETGEKVEKELKNEVRAFANTALEEDEDFDPFAFAETS